ncbi:MAG: PIN domain-containing protein, partial [Telluria sp.]
RKADIIEEVKNAGLEMSTNLHLVVAGARILGRTEEKDATDRLIARAKSIQEDTVLQEGALILAELYFDMKRFSEAIPHYESFLPKGQHSELHNRLLCSYLKVGSTRKAKQLLESFPKEWVDDDDTRSLAIELGQLASDWRMLTSLADTQYKKEPHHISSWLFKFMVDVRRKSVSDLQAFLATAPMDLKGSIHQSSQLAGLELKYGLEANGMRRLYQMRRQNLENVESASALVLTILGVTPHLPHMEEHLDIVSPGTSLALQDDKGISHTLTIDPAELPLLPETVEFKPTSSEEAARFIGAKVGTQVEVDGPFGQTRTVTVTAISSAYRRLHDCAYRAVSNPISPASNLMSVSVPTGPDGKADFSEMLVQLQRSRAHGNAAMHQYETHPISLGFLGKLLGKNPIELVQFWPSRGPALKCCDGTLPERMAAVGLIEDLARTFVIDGATLAEFVFLECTAALAIFPTLYVSEIARDNVYGMLEAAKHNRSVGQAFEEDGKLGFIEHTEATHKREVARLESVVSAIEQYCVVLPAYGPEEPVELLLELKELTSAEEYSTLLLAAEKEAVLVTLDGNLRSWAAAVSIQGVWTQAVLMQAERTGVVSKDQYAIAAARLFIANRSFTALNSYDLLLLCMQGDSWLQFGFVKYVQHLAHPKTEFRTALKVALNFIQDLSSQPTTVGVIAEFLRHLVHGLLRHPECPATTMDLIDYFLGLLCTPRPNCADFYPPSAHERRLQSDALLGLLKAAARDGEAWSNEPWRDREIQIRVLNGGRSPLFVHPKLQA